MNQDIQWLIDLGMAVIFALIGLVYNSMRQDIADQKKMSEKMDDKLSILDKKSSEMSISKTDIEKDVGKISGSLESLQQSSQANDKAARDSLHEVRNKFSEYPQRSEMDRRIQESEMRVSLRVDRMEKAILDELKEIKGDVKEIRDRP